LHLKAIFLNESIYPQPEKFIPERSLPPSLEKSAEKPSGTGPGYDSEIWSVPLDLHTIAFGFGKRCGVA
jgi:cytochrome P450